MSTPRKLPRRGTLERARLDAFFGGYCCALSAACYGDDGTSTSYVEAVAAAGADELLAYARREDEMELPKIRAAVESIKRRERRQADMEARRRASRLGDDSR